MGDACGKPERLFERRGLPDRGAEHLSRIAPTAGAQRRFHRAGAAGRAASRPRPVRRNRDGDARRLPAAGSDLGACARRPARRRGAGRAGPVYQRHQHPPAPCARWPYAPAAGRLQCGRLGKAGRPALRAGQAAAPRPCRFGNAVHSRPPAAAHGRHLGIQHPARRLPRRKRAGAAAKNGVEVQTTDAVPLPGHAPEYRESIRFLW